MRAGHSGLCDSQGGLWLLHEVRWEPWEGYELKSDLISFTLKESFWPLVLITGCWGGRRNQRDLDRGCFSNPAER